MTAAATEQNTIQGLAAADVMQLRRQYGANTFHAGTPRRFIHIARNIVKEPMFILLFAACLLYFILGEVPEGLMMLVAMMLIAAISMYQEVKSSNALKALKQFSQPKVKVIRDGKEEIIEAEGLVPGDIMLLEEGMNIPADAVILQQNDFTVNESVITGESIAADKNETEGNNLLYQGTAVNSGKCVARVTATANNTVLGKLGKSVDAGQSPKTPLQVQLNRFVRRLAIFGLVSFLIIFLVNYLHYREWVASLLFALTVAMSAVPEELPVAFSSFMALGAFKMSKSGIITRQPQIIENLGAVSVICLDKTGTITENKMRVHTIYDFKADVLFELKENEIFKNTVVLEYAALASETNPFDAMEKAIWEAFELYAGGETSAAPKMIYEYPLQGNPPMMSHVYEQAGTKKIAAKGAFEKIIEVCKLGGDEKEKIILHAKSLASKGYRVIGVAGATHTGAELPALQEDFEWRFEGLLALYDPPKANIREVLQQFYDAKIEVKLITGDSPETAINIAGKAGIFNHLRCVTGAEIAQLNSAGLLQVAQTTNVFARMFPDAKLKIIEALKSGGAVVAMTGDGVNDGPALKAAGIGIAMGQKGTGIAREAADLILTDDNLQRMVTAVNEGRKIFSNLKKAIRYIISIHIPIILTASLPVIFGWMYPNIFTPIHIIFLELIMGPTCSVFFEKEPVEENIMRQAPRAKNTALFTREELLISVVQGLIITTGALLLYYYAMNSGAGLKQTRTIVFTTIILSNIFLTFANRSFTKTIWYTSRYKNSLAPVLLIVSALFLAALHFVPFVRNLFQLAPVSGGWFGLCFGVAAASVLWFEVYKTDLQKLKSRLK
jgi:P-type Ca2+ transporter type 2C